MGGRTAALSVFRVGLAFVCFGSGFGIVLEGCGRAKDPLTSTGGRTGSGGRSQETGGGGSGGADPGSGGTSSSGGHGSGGGAGSGSGGGSAGSSGSGGTSGVGGGTGTGGSGGDGVGGREATDPVWARGQYMVKDVLKCGECHTPGDVGVGVSPPGVSLSGVDCFVNSGGSCLSSGNLSNDASGLRDLTDQQIKDAIMLGKDPRTPGKYLFSDMPYYDFANLSSADATAIVTYLRSVPGVAHQVAANTAPYDVRPTAPQNAPVDPTRLPGAASNGKYLATLLCVTCHTVDVADSAPKIVDAARAFQGGRIINDIRNGTIRMLETGNLTPAAPGGWGVNAIGWAIRSGYAPSNAHICGMPRWSNMTIADLTDTATYLQSLPPVITTRTIAGCVE